MNNNSLSKKQAKLRESLADIFDQCQKTFAVHKSALSRVAKLHKQVILFSDFFLLMCKDPDFFKTEFIGIVNRVLIVSKREPAVERVVSFIIKSALKVASLSDDDDESKQLSEDDTEDEKPKKNKKTVHLIHLIT
jgi:hypothetical protein